MRVDVSSNAAPHLLRHPIAEVGAEVPQFESFLYGPHKLLSFLFNITHIKEK